MEKPNVRFHDGQILSEEPLNRAMEAVDAAVDAACAAQASTAAAESAATIAQSAATETEGYVQEIKTAMQSLPDGSAVSAQVALNTAGVNNIKEMVTGTKVIITKDSIDDYIAGKYLSALGDGVIIIKEWPDYFYTRPLYIKKDTEVKHAVYRSSLVGIAAANAEGDTSRYVALLKTDNYAKETETWICPEDGYYAFSGRMDNDTRIEFGEYGIRNNFEDIESNISALQDQINEINNTVGLTGVSGEFMSKVGTVAYIPDSPFISSNIILEYTDNKLSAKLKDGYTPASYNIRFAVKFGGLKTGNRYRLVINGALVRNPLLRYGVDNKQFFDRASDNDIFVAKDGNYELEFVKAYDDDPCIDITFNFNSTHTFKQVFEILEYKCIEENINRPTEYTGNEIMAFSSCVCIGDSLTAGSINTTDEQGASGPNAPSDYSKSYPAKLAKMTGMNVDVFAQGGLKTSEWYEMFKDEDMSGHDIAIIQLGVNDLAFEGGWNNNVKQAFINIIDKLRRENSNSSHNCNFIKIFICNGITGKSYGGHNKDSISDGLEQLVKDLGYGYEDVFLLDMKHYGNLAYSGYSCGHLNAAGYAKLADDYYKYISWYISNHKERFRNIQYIGTDHIYTKDY